MKFDFRPPQRTSLRPTQPWPVDQRHHAHSEVERARGQRRQERPELRHQVLRLPVSQGVVPPVRRQRQLPPLAGRPAGSQGGGVGPAASHHVHLHGPGAERRIFAQQQGACQRKHQHHHQPWRWAVWLWRYKQSPVECEFDKSAAICAVPSLVSVIWKSESTESSLTLHWSVPAQPHYNILQYQLRYCEKVTKTPFIDTHNSCSSFRIRNLFSQTKAYKVDISWF